MIENYILTEKCPQCSKKLSIDWRFCGRCGSFIGERHPKCRFKIPLDELYLVKNGDTESRQSNVNKSPQILGQMTGKIKEIVQDNLDKGEEVADGELSPLIFNISEDGVVVSKANELALNGQFIRKDVRGYYVPSKSPCFVNNFPQKTGSKHYLLNGDTVRQGENIQIFSIMNQETVDWQHQSLAEFTVDNDLTDVLEFVDASIWVNPNNNYELLLNNQALEQRIQLKPFDTLSIDYRLFVYLKDDLIYQSPLTADQRQSLASDVHSIKDDKLMVNIEERRAGDKLLLADIQFEVEAGEMVLILGGSGAGKTTLINAIMGSEKADAQITLGRKDVYKDFDQVRRMIAVVPQFSLHRERDSVYMTVKNAAEMKLPREFTRNARLMESKISEILTVTNLDHKRESLVSELSGGEKKRLSIATEYIADPVVFILDEPDSGVDGPNSRKIMESLRHIADDKKIVLLISHNPDRTPELFDKVLMLAKSKKEDTGRLAFYGTVAETLEFFGTSQLEMAIAEVEHSPDDYIEKYQRDLADRQGD